MPSLDKIAGALSEQKLPPVERWNPPFCGDSGMTILADGHWLHEGEPIHRAAMVKLFSSVLRRDPEGYRLVTPVEKLAITVEDLPFAAVELEAGGEAEAQRLAFRLNTDEFVIAGPDHALTVADERGRPALHVRSDLWARIARPVWYELCALALAAGGDNPGVWSGGCFFPLAAVG